MPGATSVPAKQELASFMLKEWLGGHLPLSPQAQGRAWIGGIRGVERKDQGPSIRFTQAIRLACTESPK